MSKVFTATAILQLRDAGRLRLDDPVGKHLPWFKVPSPFPTAPPITVEHLLTHTSGLSREAPFDAWTTHEFPTREELRAAMPRVTVISPPERPTATRTSASRFSARSSRPPPARAGRTTCAPTSPPRSG